MKNINSSAIYYQFVKQRVYIAFIFDMFGMRERFAANYINKLLLAF